MQKGFHHRLLWLPLPYLVVPCRATTTIIPFFFTNSVLVCCVDYTPPILSILSISEYCVFHVHS